MVDEKDKKLAANAANPTENSTLNYDIEDPNECSVCNKTRYVSSSGRMAPCPNCFFRIFSQFFIKNVR